MKRIKIINRIIYCVILLAFLIFMGSAFIFSTVDMKTPADSKTRISIKPENTRYIGDGKIEYHIKLDATSGNNMALAFVSRHQNVEVYAGDKLIYYVRNHKSIYGTTTGTNYTIINVPSYTTDVVVRLTNVYDGYKARETSFEYGDETRIIKELIAESLPSVILSSFIILVGFAMVILWIICRKNIAQTEALFYFGLFAMIIGAWALNETDLATLLIEDRKIASLIGYMLLMIMPVPFIQAEKNFFQAEKKSVVSNVLCALFTVIDIVLLVCHMTAVKEFKNSVYIIHMMLIISLIYFCGVLIKRIHVNGFDRKVKANIIGAAALGISMIVDLIAYYKGMQQTDHIGKHETSDYEGYSIATFDLNNLKWCNDNLGHAAGDAYIQASARIIKEIFGSHGKCYRIGGDEFCTVINQKSKKFDNARHVKQLRELEKYAEKELGIKGLNVQIACGYAEYDIKTDKNFEDTRSRADKKMYESKRRLKRE